MTIIICPGIHSPELTEQFISEIQHKITAELLILPTEIYPPYSAIAVYQWLIKQNLLLTEPLSFISFSAGVVGSFGAAWAWQLQGGKIHSFIAVDGWGMPLFANFPIYRVSHDRFTHCSSAILGGRQGFYADPEVEHLEIWQSPNIPGWQEISLGCKTRTTLINYLTAILNT